MAVLNKHKDHIPLEAIYIGRGTKYGNPFPMSKKSDRPEVIDKYKRYIKHQIKMGNVTLQDLAGLHNKDLVCFCAPLPCHGHVLEKLAAWAYDKLNPMQTEKK